MSNLKNRISEFMLSSQIMIENSLTDNTVKTALVAYGYTEEKLLAGKKLFEEVSKLQFAQKKEFGEQMAATAELNEAWEAANQKYMRTLKIARIALKNKVKADKAIMLFGDRKQSISGWLDQAKSFYGNTIDDAELLNILSGYGYTPEKLNEEAALVERVFAKYLQQRKEIGEAQEATEIRERKLDELAKWISELRAVAKVALEDDPQQLEKIGILARSK